MEYLSKSSLQNEENNDDLVPRLMNKISLQAMELSKLNSKLEKSSSYREDDDDNVIALEKSYHHNVAYNNSKHDLTSPQDICSDLYNYDNGNSSMKNSQNSAIMSEIASKKRMERDYNLQIDILQRQLQSAEAKLLEQNKSKKKVIHDLETKSRELKLFEKLLHDKDIEINNLKKQLESTLRISSSLSSSQFLSQTKTKNKSLLQNNQSVLIEKMKKEIEIHKENEHQLNSKIRILEDALEFRSDEVGLSGKADLLSMMAKLKGEILALKTELMDKTKKLVEVEEKKGNLSDNNENLHRQITNMQQRLAQTQVDSFKLANNDLIQLLKNTEEERDKLLKYVQNDLQKGVSMNKQIENLEAEISYLRNKESTLESIIHEMEMSSKTNMIAKTNYDSEVNKNKELLKSIEIIQMEKDYLSKQLERKTLECNEVGREHLDKLNMIMNKDEEITSLKDKNTNNERSIFSLQSENNNLKQKVKFLEDELLILKESVSTMEPKIHRIEPEYNKLLDEREKWLEDKSNITKEINQFRYSHQLLSELNSDLMKANDILNISYNSPNKTNVNNTQKHLLWINNPIIKTISSLLFDNIKSLHSDLQKKDIECNELESKLNSLKKDISIFKKEDEIKLSQSTQYIENSNKTIQNLKNQLEVTEYELSSLANSKIIIEKIRQVLKNFPGDIKKSLSHILKRSGSIMNHNFNNKDNKVSPSQYDSIYSPEYLSKKKSFQNEEVNHRIGFHEMKDDEDSEDVWSLVTNDQLPDIISKALLINNESIKQLEETQFKLNKLEDEYNLLQWKQRDLQKSYNDLDSKYYETSEKLSVSERRLIHFDHEYTAELESAAELAEKQNALLMTLEAKIEGLTREKNLKSAQLTGLQQREDSIRIRLLKSLKIYAQNTNSAVPPDNMKIVDLINYNSDVLNRFIMNDNNNNEFDRIINNDNSPAFENNQKYNNKNRLKRTDELSDNDFFAVTTNSIKSQSIAPNNDKKKKVSPSNDMKRSQSPKLRKTPSPSNTFSSTDNKLSVSKLETNKRNSMDRSPINRINPFQARLKKAQQAFNALKETHSD